MTRSTDVDAAWELIRAVRRAEPGTALVVDMQDPVRSGSRLRSDGGGSWTSSGPVSAEARDLLDLFLPLCPRGELVIAQAGQSLDGRIATLSGHSHYVTGHQDIRRLHRLRALVDAVVVGAGTVVADDPRLTVREVEGENPVRVVVDPQGRIPPGAKVLQDGAAPTLVLGAAPRTFPPPTPPGVESLVLPTGGDGSFQPAGILGALRERGLRWVLVEGGGVTVSRFLQAGVLHRLHVTVAPLIIGSGRPAFTLDPVATLEQAIRPRCRHFRLGEDLLFDLDLDPG